MFGSPRNLMKSCLKLITLGVQYEVIFAVIHCSVAQKQLLLVDMDVAGCAFAAMEIEQWIM